MKHEVTFMVSTMSLEWKAMFKLVKLSRFKPQNNSLNHLVTLHEYGDKENIKDPTM